MVIRTHFSPKDLKRKHKWHYERHRRRWTERKIEIWGERENENIKRKKIQMETENDNINREKIKI